MTCVEMKSAVVISLFALVVLLGLYQYNPSLFNMFQSREGFQEPTAPGTVPPAALNTVKPTNGGVIGPQPFKNMDDEDKEGYADLKAYEGTADFGSAQSPAGCYPRDQLTPSELLPKDMNSIWAEQNPMGPGSLKGKNFLSAGALIGVNTVGQSLRNANLQVRSEPPNPQVAVSIFNQSTISPDISHRPLEIGA